MTPIKKHIVYFFLCLTGVTTISGIISAFLFKSAVTGSIFAAVIAECAAVITTIIKAKGYFEDPESITKLDQRYRDELQSKDAQLAAQANAYALNLQAKEHKIQDLNATIEILRNSIQQASPAVVSYNPGR